MGSMFKIGDRSPRQLAFLERRLPWTLAVTRHRLDASSATSRTGSRPVCGPAPPRSSPPRCWERARWRAMGSCASRCAPGSTYCSQPWRCCSAACRCSSQAIPRRYGAHAAGVSTPASARPETAIALGGAVLGRARSMHPRYSWVSLEEAHRCAYDGSHSRAQQLTESGAPTVMRSR